MQSLQELFGSLEIGKRYTIVGFNSFGFPYSWAITLRESKFEPEQVYLNHFEDSVRLEFVLKGKRKLNALRVKKNDKFLVFNGWVDVNADMWVQEEQTEAVMIRESLHCFDPEYMSRALASFKEAPLVTLNVKGTESKSILCDEEIKDHQLHIYNVCRMGELLDAKEHQYRPRACVFRSQ